MSSLQKLGVPEYVIGRSSSGGITQSQAQKAEEFEMDPVSIILVGVSAGLMVALFIWSMNMLTTLDARPAESDE